MKNKFSCDSIAYIHIITYIYIIVICNGTQNIESIYIKNIYRPILAPMSNNNFEVKSGWMCLYGIFGHISDFTTFSSFLLLALVILLGSLNIFKQNKTVFYIIFFP